MSELSIVILVTVTPLLLYGLYNRKAKKAYRSSLSEVDRIAFDQFSEAGGSWRKHRHINRVYDGGNS